MPIERSTRPISSIQLTSSARRLLDASSLCAIATVSPRNRPHINTAYFAWSRELDLVWLSEPHARHSRNVHTNRNVAIAVYDSNQSWGKPDRGIQLFGSARELVGRAALDSRATYARRFPEYADTELTEYRFYRFRPRRVKLFDEPSLGSGVFVTGVVDREGQVHWQRTEIYRTQS